MSGDDTGPEELLERRYRMTLDFRVLVTDLRWQDDGKGSAKDRRHRRERAERQVRLLRALLRDEAALREFMTYLLTDRVCGHQENELGRVFGVRPEEEMLEPVYSKMSEDDAQFFREVAEEGLFMDNTWEFEESFAVDWLGANLSEVRWETEGDPTAADDTRDLDAGKVRELIRGVADEGQQEESDNLM